MRITPAQAKAILSTMEIECKTSTSIVYPPLACGYGLSNPADILEFANKVAAFVMEQAHAEQIEADDLEVNPDVSR